MKSINMHSDTLMIARMGGLKADMLDLPQAMVDLRRMRAGEMTANFFAIFLIPQEFYSYMKTDPVPDEQFIRECAAILKRNLTVHGEMIAAARSAQDIRANEAAGKLSAVLTMEDGRAVDGKLENLRAFYDMGVRALSLTWNYENCFGAPNSQDPAIMSRGLTPFGKSAVRYMQELGMLVDVSHLSDGGFYDVAAICEKPFVATHSNARALSPHPRNMTDDMIRVLADHGGVMGLNFGPEFLNEDLKDTRSTVERMVAMAKHEKNVGGIDVVAIGTDFDGIGGELEIGSCDKMDLLVQGLSRGGFTDDEIEKIFWRNTYRVMEEAMG